MGAKIAAKEIHGKGNVVVFTMPGQTNLDYRLLGHRPLSHERLRVLLWLFGGLGAGRVHPVVITYLVLVICFGSLLVPRRVLNIDHMLSGDVLKSAATDTRTISESWIGRRHTAADAEYQEPAAARLTRDEARPIAQALAEAHIADAQPPDVPAISPLAAAPAASTAAQAPARADAQPALTSHGTAAIPRRRSSPSARG